MIGVYFYELYFTRDDDYERDGVECLYYSSVKLQHGEFSNICKDIFDKNATKTLAKKYIDIDKNHVDWDIELEKYGLYPFRINIEELFSVEVVGGYSGEE